MKDYYSPTGKFAERTKRDMTQDGTSPEIYCLKTPCAMCEYVCYSRNNGCPLAKLKDDNLSKSYKIMLEDATK